jgi:hypothetical protein
MGILPMVAVLRDVRSVLRSKKARAQRPLLRAVGMNRGADNREEREDKREEMPTVTRTLHWNCTTM